MPSADETSCVVPFTSSSSLTSGLHVHAALGSGSPHLFQIDTGSVGILVPRKRLGSDYQDFDPSQDIKFEYVSSGKTYWGQWVSVPVVLGVPTDWDGTGEYPAITGEVFAANYPKDFDGGIFGIGFGINGSADGGPARNPLLGMTYQGVTLSRGYIVSTGAIEVGLTAVNTSDFQFVGLECSGGDWVQPTGTVALSDGFQVDLPFLMDTGIDEMLLALEASARPQDLASDSQFPPGIGVSITVPSGATAPALQYSFVTGQTGQPMAPQYVKWLTGHSINTGRNVLAGADYLYDATGGRIGFRSSPA